MRWLILGLFLPLPGWAAETCEIEVWERKPGYYAEKETYKKLGVDKVQIGKGKPLQKWDLQYDKKLRFRGYALKDILNQSKSKRRTQQVLLHFKNGMIVPHKGEDIFVATAIFEDKKWSTKFPEISKEHERYKDPRPLTFGCNKLVVHKKPTKEFYPWQHTDTLTGVEFVNLSAYEAQFLPPKYTKKVAAGYKIFLQHCSSCHSIKNIGATYGWDYVDPLKMHERRNKQSLLYHVSIEKIDKLERGLMMPAQKRLDEEKVDALWEWMRAAATQKLPPYKP